ncbi:MAG TPA: hypothetical protein VMZ50_03355 [Phycisphaerae bacterium]|nr:hypothetical protein [Phycisphaerae bacterium]
MKCAAILPVVLTAFLAAGCVPAMELPGSFIEVSEADRGMYDLRAVSADGAVLAVRRQDNPQKGTLEFWTEAVKNELTTGPGYKLLKTEPVTSTSGVPGQLLTFAAEKRGVDYTYLVGLYVGSRGILVAEAGGKAEAVKARLDEIKKAMLTVR